MRNGEVIRSFSSDPVKACEVGCVNESVYKVRKVFMGGRFGSVTDDVNSHSGEHEVAGSRYRQEKMQIIEDH